MRGQRVIFCELTPALIMRGVGEFDDFSHKEEKRSRLHKMKNAVRAT